MNFAGGLESDLLEFLDRVHAAVEDRDPESTRRLLAEPLAVHLPREVREEALALSADSIASFRAPLHLLRYYHRTVQLLRAPSAREVEGEGRSQLELELPPHRSQGSLRVPEQARAAARPVRD